MDFERIKFLSGYIPDDSPYINPHGRPLSRTERSVEKFVKCYRDLAFGHHFVHALLESGRMLPPDVSERHICDLYWLERFQEDSEVLEAAALNHPSNKFVADALQSFLLSDTPIPKISKHTGVAEETIRAYEQLYFNIRDRRKEALLIAQVVYPQTRLVEQDENYTRDAGAGSIIKRAAYNSGFDEAAYLVGLKVDSVKDMFEANSKELANRLETTIMANGYFLAKSGFLSQRNAQGVSAARNLIMAAKQSGVDQGEDDDVGATSIGEALMSELTKVKSQAMQDRISRLTDESEGGSNETMSKEDLEVLEGEE